MSVSAIARALNLGWDTVNALAVSLARGARLRRTGSPRRGPLPGSSHFLSDYAQSGQGNLKRERCDDTLQIHSLFSDLVLDLGN